MIVVPSARSLVGFSRLGADGSGAHRGVTVPAIRAPLRVAPRGFSVEAPTLELGFTRRGQVPQRTAIH